MFGLVQQPERGVPRAVGAQRHDVLQLLQAVPQVRPPVLLQLVVGRPDGKRNSYYRKMCDRVSNSSEYTQFSL